MADSFRALCAELVDALDSGIPTGRICMSPLANRARAALAEPDGCDFPVCFDDDSEEGTCSRWLAGSCEGPASAARARALLAEPEAEGPTDEELEEEFGAALLKLSGDSMNATAVAFARAVLARWGRPAAAPVPEPGEVGELVAELELMANHAATACQFGDAETLSYAAALLQQQAAPAPVAAPVPVSERLPGPEDCDEQGRCWLGGHQMGSGTPTWLLGYPAWAERFPDVHRFWLPANALPLPAPEETK